MKSLLQKAKESQRHASHERKFTSGEIELIYAWINDEVGLVQVGKAMGTTSTGVYSFLALGMKAIIRNGKK